MGVIKCSECVHTRRHLDAYIDTYIKSQNWNSSVPTPLLTIRYIQKVAQDIVYPGFEFFQRWRLQHLSGKSVHAFNYPHNKKTQKFKWIFLYFICVHCLFTCLWAPRNLSVSSLLPPITHFTHKRKIFLSFLFSRAQYCRYASPELSREEGSPFLTQQWCFSRCSPAI